MILIRDFEVELKTKPKFICTHIPLIKVTGKNDSEAITKALNKAVKKLDFRREAIEFVNVKELKQ